MSKTKAKPSYLSSALDEKLDLSRSRVLLTGAQAVVRLALMQAARDRLDGLKTAGYISGYRGSPIAGVENQLLRASSYLQQSHIKFHPGLNEDLAATAVWGTQQAELKGEGRFDGVFAYWYGKGPGVDRSGDVFKHANAFGSSPHGGVVALMGDDHTCESSTLPHQSEFAFVDAMIPVLNPSCLQDLIDYGLYGIALSRYAGVWVGLKCVKDTIEATKVVDGRLDRLTIMPPKDHRLPPGGLNARRNDDPHQREARLHEYKMDAVHGFVRENRLDRIVLGQGADAKIGIATTGKSYLDVRQALELLGLDEAGGAKAGLRLYKIALTWPLERRKLLKFTQGLDFVIVVEEKRGLIEDQLKTLLYGSPSLPKVIGKKDLRGQILFPVKGALSPLLIAETIADVLKDNGVGGKVFAKKRGEIEARLLHRKTSTKLPTRMPFYCAGCPHNSSTVVPEGSKAFAGIGCHYMAQWMDRDTEGFTQMGGEGANWIGEAPFSTRGHMFQNLGDGTYCHSGILAVRAAVAAGVNITYKLLFNDAVAMTGGQPLDGGMTVGDVARQLWAEGVAAVTVVSEAPETYGAGTFSPATKVVFRDELDETQRKLSKIKGVTALIYDQTCAAKKRRLRKRGLYPDPAKRVFINEAVCEGCGDCGVRSNCVAIAPLETKFGRKRVIDQTACNKDFSCLRGFCPSFVTVHGGALRVQTSASETLPSETLPRSLPMIPTPDLPEIEGTHNILVTGIGGTGVLTVSALIAQAAHFSRLGVGAIDMTGLAQKGGAVLSHIRLAKSPSDINAIRMGPGGADVVIGGDLVVTSGTNSLDTIRKNHTRVVVSTQNVMTGAFTKDRDFKLPHEAMRRALQVASGPGRVLFLPAHDYAKALFGDAVGANVFLLGAAYQLGLLPLRAEALEHAIVLNDVAKDMNLQAFALGRLVVHDRAALDRLCGGAPGAHAQKQRRSQTLKQILDAHTAHLQAYQNKALSQKYRAKVAKIVQVEQQVRPGQNALAKAFARSYGKVLAYKDEYEVARLFSNLAFKEALATEFQGKYSLEFHLAPPWFARRDPITGHLRKSRFGPWIMHVFRMLAPLKGLRGTWFDPFGYSAERQLERRLIKQSEDDACLIMGVLCEENFDKALLLLRLPLDIRGFGHVKQDAVKRVFKTRETLLAALCGETKDHAVAA